VGGVDEVVEDDRTGLLVPPGNAEALAAALDRLLGDSDLRRRLAAAGRRQVMARHGLAAMAEGHRRAFAAAIARAAGAEVSIRPEGAEPSAERPRVAHVTTVALSLRYLLLAQLQAIRTRGYEVAGISAPGADAAVLLGHGIPHHPVPMTRRLTPVRDFVSLVRLWREMRKGRFTIVHTHTPKPGLLGQMAARLAGVPVVVNTLHGFYFHDRMHPWARRAFVALERLAARFSDLVLSQNPEDVETAVREGIVARDRIRLLGNGIDLHRFDPRRVEAKDVDASGAALGIPEGAPVVGFVGRLVAEKGLGELLTALRIVREAHPGVRLLVVGPADDEKRSTIGPDHAEAAGVRDAVVFAGLRDDMPLMYSLMDVFVLPSHREGFPRAAMEAAAMGVPAVVTDIRGCRQVVAHGRNGLLFPVGDANALAAAIVCLLDAPRLARRLGDEGRLRAGSEFDERAVFARVIEAYDQLLRAKGLSTAVPFPRGLGESEAVRAAG
jgi:glycosyltransferase involved in cell wall biosynthesis